MKLEWKKILLNTTIWLAVEIMLNLLGLDNLADYSEFIYEHKFGVSGRFYQPAIISPCI